MIEIPASIVRDLDAIADRASLEQPDREDLLVQIDRLRMWSFEPLKLYAGQECPLCRATAATVRVWYGTSGLWAIVCDTCLPEILLPDDRVERLS